MKSADEENDITEPPFVGRTTCFHSLAKAWTKYRIFGVYGLRAVGKSRTVKEFFKKKVLVTKDEVFEQTKELIVDMRSMADTRSLYMNLCAHLEIEPMQERHGSRCRQEWKRQITETISKRSKVLYLILFDNMEDIMEGPMKDEFLELVSSYLVTLYNMKTFITSTTKAMFTRIKRSYFIHELGPMPDYEASQLLDEVAPDVDLGEFKDAIVKLSEGLPLVLLMVGSEMTAEEGLIKPKEMVEFLTDCRLHALSRENYPEDDRVGDVYRKFINRLSETFRQRLAILGCIPGSFTAEEAKSMLVPDHQMAPESLMYLRNRSMITQDTTTRRFNIQGVLRECLHVYFSIKALPEIRRRYCETFVKVMKTLCHQLGTEEYTKALSQFSQEQSNLQKLLTEVYYSTTETYPFFIKVASDCTELIERFMSKESKKFYDGCLEMAYKFSRQRDMATVHIAIGSMYTNAKGEFTAGGESYLKALNLLRNGEKTLLLATLYQRYGYNLYTRGMYTESIKYLKEAFDIHLHLKTDRTPLALQTFNSLGIVYNVMGNFREAEKYLFEGLRRRELIHGKDHYGVGAAKNNIGLMYDLMGEHKLALEYYTEGLEIKKKAETPTWSLVYSMNNIAEVYRKMRQYSKATALLQEAVQKLNQEEFPHKGAVSLIYDTFGKVCLSQGKCKNASELFEKAIEVKKEISDGGVSYLESVVHLAKAQQELGNHMYVIKLLKKVLNQLETTNKDMPANTVISETLEVLADTYTSMRKLVKLKTTLELLQSELMRQERVYIGFCNDKRVNEIIAKLNTINISLRDLCQKTYKGTEDTA